MKTKAELIAQAEALEWVNALAWSPTHALEVAAAKAKELRAQASQAQEQEPVAKVRHTVTAGYEHTDIEWLRHDLPANTPLYTHPPQTHSDHPSRHWDRTCPACNTAADAPNREAGSDTDKEVAFRSAVGVPIVCHAPGDRCARCEHYNGRAPVCRYAAAETAAVGVPDLVAELSAIAKQCEAVGSRVAVAEAENVARQELVALRGSQLVEQAKALTALQEKLADHEREAGIYAKDILQQAATIKEMRELLDLDEVMLNKCLNNGVFFTEGFKAEIRKFLLERKT